MLKKIFHNSYFIIHNSSSASQRGASTIYIVIIIVMVIFAVMFAGGPSYLLSGDLPSTVTETPAPSQDDSTGTNPTATPSANIAWNITYILEYNCTGSGSTGSLKGQAKAEGPQDGYVVLEVQQGNTFTPTDYQAFSPQRLYYPMNLKNSDGFSTNNWRLLLYSGGNQVSDNLWEGGTLEKQIGGAPTGCS